MRAGVLFATATAILLAAASTATAASYSTSITSNLLSLQCSVSGASYTCGTFSLIAPEFLNATDQDAVTVNYTSPVFVQGSRSENVLYDELFDPQVVSGAVPGPNASTVTSSLAGYVGPKNPLLGPYTNSYLHGYIGAAGFIGVPNSGFSATGISTNFQILAGDPLPIVGIAYGYTIVLPAVPKALFHFAGGTVADPVNLPGLVDGTEAIIPTTVPHETFYSFVWRGGLFEADGSAPEMAGHLQLLDLTTGTLLDDEILGAAGPTIKTDLPKGVYEIGLATTGPGVPFSIPPFTEAFVNFLTPVNGIPEPATIAILGAAGLAGAAASRNRRKKA